MPGDATGRADERVERVMGRLLLVGVLVAAGVVLVGGGAYLVRHGGEPADQHASHGEPAELRTPAGIAAEAAALGSRGVILFGLLALIATPVAREAFSVFTFVRERDTVDVLATLFVLGVLLYSLSGNGP
jgi:uncharacterized membrane protein